MALVGLAALAAYLVPRLVAARAPWLMWDVTVYWWGGHQALHNASLYAAHEPRSFTYPPAGAAIFGLASGGPEIVLKISMIMMNFAALATLALGVARAAGLGRRPEATFAISALALYYRDGSECHPPFRSRPSAFRFPPVSVASGHRQTTAPREEHHATEETKT